jgi:hypothetical protein
MNAPVQDRLLFDWESPRSRKLAVLGFLAASAAGHALCFYLFQIVYPPTVALLPPPGRVNLISNNTEEGRTLLRWIDAEDPALATTTQRSPDAKTFALPRLSHTPSYLTIQPALKGLPPLVADPPARSTQPPGPVPMTPERSQSIPSPVPTTIIFSRDLESMGAVEKPAMKFTASTSEAPQGARFRIAVTESGVVRYCFLESSSGDPALDEQARRYLTLCRFAGNSNSAETRPDSLRWTVAIVEWGNDIVMPPSPAENVP